MSRIGKKILNLPAGTEITVEGDEIVVKGKKGTLKETLRPGLRLEREGNVIHIKRDNESHEVRALHGMTRNLVANMLKGVSEGFQKKLSIVGVGYKAEIKGKTLVLQLGYSHPIEFAIPAGIEITYDKTANMLTISGSDKKQVGEVAACIRRFRGPEPYKGKGVMYAGEKIRRKVGKTGTK